MKYKTTVILFVFFLFSMIVKGQSDKMTQVDEFVKNEMKKRNIPGLTLIILKDGKATKESAYGVANVELNVPATVNTVYPIASATKSITATALLTLVDEGKLKLDDNIQTLLPGLPESWGSVTVKQLLSHTSGLPDIAVRPGRPELIADNQEEALRKLSEMPLQFKPGERWAYNQTNYVLLGMIIEKITGLSFQEFIKQRFFVPLGMTSTSYGDANDVIIGRASTYQTNKRGQLQTLSLIFPNYVRTAAGINTTVGDLAKWLNALKEGKVIKSSTQEIMWEAIKLNDGNVFRLDKKTIGYGLGWVVNDRPGHKIVGHSGGGTAVFNYLTQNNLTIIVLMNGQNNPDSFINGIVSILIPE